MTRIRGERRGDKAAVVDRMNNQGGPERLRDVLRLRERAKAAAVKDTTGENIALARLPPVKNKPLYRISIAHNCAKMPASTEYNIQATKLCEISSAIPSSPGFQLSISDPHGLARRIDRCRGRLTPVVSACLPLIVESV